MAEEKNTYTTELNSKHEKLLKEDCEVRSKIPDPPINTNNFLIEDFYSRTGVPAKMLSDPTFDETFWKTYGIKDFQYEYEKALNEE